MTTHIRSDVSDNAPYGPEKDACALFLSTRKRGQSTFGTLRRALTALSHMGHRTGFVEGEGDGAGIQTDIPREVWARRLTQAGLRSSLATRPGFWVGHLFVPHDVDFQSFHDQVVAAFNESELGVLIDEPGRVRAEALGRTARRTPSLFWQFAGYSDGPDVEKRLFAIQMQLESSFSIHFASLSTHTVVYKVRGSVETLAHYFPVLKDRTYATAMVLCHARYSTNTVSNFERAQPFALLGHNGEINTISRLRQEATQIGVQLPQGGSDSQDVDRTLQMLCVEYGLDLIEAIELVFPPIPYELDLLPPTLRATYFRGRQSFGPYAQGPAAIAARYGDVALFSVDALGLRPLWFVETEKEYIFSSERGAIPLESMADNTRPLAPGEKMAFRANRGQSIEVLTHSQIRQHVLDRNIRRAGTRQSDNYWTGWQREDAQVPINPVPGSQLVAEKPRVAQELATATATATQARVNNVLVAEPAGLPGKHLQETHSLDIPTLAALGWQREHVQEIETMASSGKDPIGALGHDGPLAVLSHHRVNIADFYKESVAVVTNPAIDRGREAEAFSTSTLIGTRPEIGQAPNPDALLVTLESPLLPGGISMPGSDEVARRLNTPTIEQLLAVFDGSVERLDCGVQADETVEMALERLAAQAIEAVRSGAQCVLIDDARLLTERLGWLDPHLVTAYIDDTLRDAGDNPNLRRRAGIVVRSASVRTLHDIGLLCGFGADAINPYAMLEVALNTHTARQIEDEQEQIERQYNLLNTLRIGLEKVISTMGCHELRGYGRVCSTIGLAPSVAAALNTANYFGSEEVGMTWQRLNEEAAQRGAELRGEGSQPRLAKVDRFYPKFWKKVESYAKDEIEYKAITELYQRLSAKIPVTLRHTLGLKHVSDDIDPADVDISIGEHGMPFVIGAMSFGSQGELSYKSYAHSASVLNIICVNGEGGELPEVMGVYKANRGQQVASGRFGVNAEFLNSAAVLEIKVGQGAKPGEGGLLPGFKVTPQVAEARRTSPYISLLSPSNNHDLYSIEDLAQLIEELKTVNPYAKVSVKCPVVPGIGVIAVGVAKAGADIINLTGYDGGTGAARRHALRYVGLPAEIGVIQAHRALTEAGIRDTVELWCDGGMKSGQDAIKMILLGANRVGFATMAMVAIGCTICRKCNDGSCHVGIATHIKTVEEAQEKLLPSFVPRHYDHSVEGIVRVFEGIGQELRQLTASLGATCVQDLVGRADLLEQVSMQDKVDLSSLFESVQVKQHTSSDSGRGQLLIRPRNTLTRIMSELIMDTISEDLHETTYEDEVMAFDRALGAHLAGELARNPQQREWVDTLHLRFGPSSIAGNGAAAWITDGMDILIEGGAQDGVAKGASGGRVAVMKGLNHDGMRIDGSVGKSFAYGAQRGILIVQGNADSRACVRLSGADVVLAGEITEPIDDSAGNVATKANLKGFACEYMTSGRVLIMGDPGPYAFAGMTGGDIYQLLTPEMGFDTNVLANRIAQGAEVVIQQIDQNDSCEIQQLLGYYIEALEQTYQSDMAERIAMLCAESVIANRFVKIVAE